MSGLQLADFTSVIEAVTNARSVRDLVALTENVDNEFLNKRLAVSDEEWPRFNEAIKQKLAGLEDQKLQSSSHEQSRKCNAS